MAALAPPALPVADFGALSVVGVFDEIDISRSLVKGGIFLDGPTAGLVALSFNGRQT
jgi:hypothetical protein